MSIKEKYQVLLIKKSETKEWILKKHYAHRMPSIVYAFGLYQKNILEGICTFGQPPPGFNNSSAIIKSDLSIKVLELNRLVINQIDKNQGSYFISQCLKLLPRPLIVVSYADTKQYHHGYIYQATNWIYTGLNEKTGGLEYFINGEWKHNKTLADKHGSRSINFLNKIYPNALSRKISQKYRYFMFLGTKKEKKEMLQVLKYSILPYPKGDNKRYDASYKPRTQRLLF